MKLNKVMALALSGLMAVSMLAGCSNGTPNGEENNEGQVIATDAATAMNNVQDTITFKADAEHNGFLTAAIAKAKYDDVKNAAFTVSGPNGNTVSKNVYNYLKDNLGTVYNLKATISNFTPKHNADNSLTYLYVVESAGVSQETALNMVAANLTATANKYPSDPQEGTTGKYYAASYTGKVSVANVTKTEPEGTKTESAYFVLVTVTQSVSNTESTWGN